jgi:hypothetical protein
MGTSVPKGIAEFKSNKNIDFKQLRGNSMILPAHSSEPENPKVWC